MYRLIVLDSGEFQPKLNPKFQALLFAHLHLLQSGLAQFQNEHLGDSKARSPVLQIVWDVKAEVL